MSIFDIVKIKFLSKTKITLIISVCGLLLLPIVTQAANSQLNDLYNKQSQLNQQIQQNQKAADQKRQEAQQFSSSIKTLNDDIATTEAKINSLQEDINNTQLTIDDLAKQIQQKEEELAREEINKNNTIRAIYQAGEPNTFELLVGSNTLSEAIDQSQYFEMLERRIADTISEISRLKGELESQKQELENKKKEMDKLKSEQEAYRQGLVIQKQEKEVLLGNTQAKQREFEGQVQEAQKLSTQVEAEIARIQEEMRNSTRNVLARDRGTSAVGFSWPTNYKYISAYYGGSTPFQSFHTGIDLANIPGTPIYTAAGGTVVTVTDMMINGHYYGYGKYVVIGHNARYSSLYAHLMGAVVAPGDEVKEGDVIGYMGTTGWSTGPHLHFEIWEYGQRQNPINYLP